jgi:tRNA(fMet)-specific endonuclease VapC
MLDTDICSYIIKGNNENIKQNLVSHQSSHICISSITKAELTFWSLKRSSEKITKTINDFIKMLDVVPFDTASADIYAALRNNLERSGTIIGNMDLLIASCAIANNAILVTNNEKHFSRIDNLEIQNWS